MIANSITDPTSTQGSTPSAPQNTATTQPIGRLTPTPTAPTTQPAASPVSAYPTAPAAPTTPPPLTTSDPLAFSPTPTQPYAQPYMQPYTVPGGATYVGGTQTTDPVTGAVTNPGALGFGYVPGTNGAEVDLGQGMIAPTPGTDVSGGVLQDLGSTPQGVVLDANGYPVWAATGQPWTGQDQVNYAASFLHGASPYTGEGYVPTFSGPSASGVGGTPVATGGNVIPTNAPTLPPASTSGSRPTPVTANDAGTPSIPSAGFSSTPGWFASIIGGAPAPPQGGTPGASSSYAPGVSLTPTTVDNALTNDTIAPGPMADRFKIAQDEWQNFVNATQPQYDAQIRDAERNAFGAGRGVSGALRTSLGDLANQRLLALDTQKNAFLNKALSGSIEDAYRNIGIAQQQQGFQAGQQSTAFNQALQQLLAGSSGDPTQTALILSSIFGGQGQNLGQALGNYTAAQQANQNTPYPWWLYPEASTAATDPILQQGIPGVQTTGTY